MTMTGGCACGKVRFRVTLPETPQPYLCHCRMCQRSVGNVSVAMVGVEERSVTWEGEPDWYRSSPIAQRPFCSACGTSLGFRYDERSRSAEGAEKMDLTVASFDDPSGFVPVSHFGIESMHRAWLNTEGLPGMRTDDYAPIVERWEKAGADASLPREPEGAVAAGD